MYDEENEGRQVGQFQLCGELMSEVISLGGAISGEHGVGLAKTPFVREQFNEAEWNTMLAVKKALDPKNILNPGKIFAFSVLGNKKRFLSLCHGSSKTKNQNHSKYETALLNRPYFISPPYFNSGTR